MTRGICGAVTGSEASRLLIRAGLILLTLMVLLSPALDLAWNEPKLAERDGSRCQLHSNPTAVFCVAAVEESEVSAPGEMFGPPVRPPLIDASIFIPPRL